ncbi:MAG: TetR/AcrR family transcriptional regulator [bacterium]
MSSAARTPAQTEKRRTAVERRDELLSAAAIEFARRGFYGTPTTDIASRAGISHPYLFRLFPTKEELFIECIRRNHSQICEAFSAAGAPHSNDPPAALIAMGAAYDQLLDERVDLLRLQLHSQAACQEPAIAKAVREGFKSVLDTVTEVSGADPEAVREFMAKGMLLNTLGAMNINRRHPRWMNDLRQI